MNVVKDTNQGGYQQSKRPSDIKMCLKMRRKAENAFADTVASPDEN